MIKNLLIAVIFVAALSNSGCKKGKNTAEDNTNTEIPKPVAAANERVVSTVVQLQQALNLAVAGDVIILEDGTYPITVPLQFTRSGTQDKPITIRARNKHKAVIDGQLQTPANDQSGFRDRESGLIKIHDKNWLVVDGLKVMNSLRDGIHIRSSNHIVVKNCFTFNTYSSGIIARSNIMGAQRILSTFITVTGNMVEKACVDPTMNYTNECITMASVSDFEVSYNTVHNRMYTGAEPNLGGEGIDAKNACSNGLIHHNTTYNLRRVGLYVDGYDATLSNIQLYNNEVYNCGAGINIGTEGVGSTSNIKIYNNLLRDNNNTGIRLTGYEKNGVVRDILIYQNTVVRSGRVPHGNPNEGAGLWIEASNSGNNNFVVRNNIFALNPKQITARNKKSWLTLDNNIVYQATDTIGASDVNADPKFLNATSNQFWLSLGSPAIDKAITTGGSTSTIDFKDWTRPIDGDGNGSALPDMGAFEFDPARQNP